MSAIWHSITATAGSCEFDLVICAAAAFRGMPYLEVRGATDTSNREASKVFDVNLKIEMRNITTFRFPVESLNKIL